MRQLQFDQPCEDVLPRIISALRNAGYQVQRTFDLRGALLSASESFCPQHGIAPCDCQYAVLLIYGHTGRPATLILSSYQGQTRAALADQPDQRAAASMEKTILSTLSHLRPV